MAIVKASYTQQGRVAKAYIRYIESRPGKDGTRIVRTLFNSDGKLARHVAYRMIDEAKRGGYFFRLVISPDPQREDSGHDLSIREITEKTMMSLEERFNTHVQWVAAIHADHAPHRHVHILAILSGKLNVQDFKQLRETATTIALEQRHQLDVVREARERGREERQW